MNDILYTASSDAYAQERCKLDVYYPTDIQDAPVVVWFHDKIFANMQRKSPISFDIPKIFSEKLVC